MASEGSGGTPDAVSVVIPARNASRTIGEQLAALSRQDYRGEWEVIVADNASTDGTAEAAARWRGAVPSLSVVPAGARPGGNHARNVGAAHARGALLLFCDADDVVAAGWLSSMAAALRQADIVGGFLDLELLNEPGVGCWEPNDQREKGLPIGLGFLPYAVGGSLGVRAAVHRELGGFSEDYVRGADEVEFCWRAQLAGFTIAFAPGAEVHCRLRRDRWSAFKQGYGYGHGRFRLYRDFAHHGVPARDLPTAAREWTRLGLTLHHLLSPRRGVRWMSAAGMLTGRTAGSLGHRLPRLSDAPPPV
ncbi:glycosyltransferase [Streptomyces sp. NPDC048718]|uniref:glycosyltransferase n=1 Tax=Streptomyces sp. NPDC048718 TaxID=3365587 RepID=UPI003715B2F6